MAGAHDEEKKNENENKNTEWEIVMKDKEENEDDEENVGEDLDPSLNPKPVVVVEKKRQRQSSSYSETDDVGVIEATPLSSYSPDSEFDLTQIEPAFKKMRFWVEDKYLKKAPTNDSDTPASTPTPTPTPTPYPTRLRFKIVRSKPTEPKKKLLLEPPHVTYLRPRPRPRPAPKPERNDMDGPKCKRTHTSMGPPSERRLSKTPYEMVKDALTILKTEFKISSAEYDEMLEAEAEGEYSLSRVTPDTLFSMEEVVMELELLLNSIPETASSDFMKNMLLAFQNRLGLPPDPRFYNLMWTSPTHFMNYLAFVQQQDSEYDVGDAEDDNGGTNEEQEGDDKMDGNNGGLTTGGTSGGSSAAYVFENPETSAFRVQYGRLPPPSLPFFDAIDILHEFANRIENDDDFVLDEPAFVNLQCDLLLPEWFSLFELYKEQSMPGVVDFIRKYFQNSRKSWFTD